VRQCPFGRIYGFAHRNARNGTAIAALYFSRPAQTLTNGGTVNLKERKA
jgi:hypothetical protein